MELNGAGSIRDNGGGSKSSKVVGPSPSEVLGGSLFCFGLGYTSLGLVSTLKRAGWRVAGTCRSQDRVASFEASGVEAHVWRPDDGVGLSRRGMEALMGATHVLSSVPPVGDFDRDPVLADAACADALVAAAVASSPGRYPASSAAPASAEKEEEKKKKMKKGSSSTTSSPSSPLSALRWVGYLSSTGVYGDKGGAWVDESTPACFMSSYEHFTILT